jgi:hypothetical protein
MVLLLVASLSLLEIASSIFLVLYMKVITKKQVRLENVGFDELK